MQKKILALALCALIPVVTIAVARADNDEEIEDTEEFEEEDYAANEKRNVAKRMNCDDIKKEMDRLAALDELSDDDAARLAGFKTDYRAKCAKRAGGRISGRAKVFVAEKAEKPAMPSDTKGATNQDKQTTCDNPDENGCCPGEKYTDMGDLGFNCCLSDGKTCFPPMGAPKDIDPGKCEDGGNPDENGCCAGEKYTDLGDAGFNCCLPDGKTCFPPMKVK